MLFAIFVAVIRSQKHPPHPATARDRRQEGRSPLHRLLKLAILKNQRLALKKSSKSAKITFSWSTWASRIAFLRMRVFLKSPVKTARRDPCGGRRVTGVPTAMA